MKNTHIEKQEIQALYKNNKFGWLGTLILFIAMLVVMQAKFSTLIITYIAMIFPAIVLHVTNDMAFTRAVTEPHFTASTWAKTSAFITGYSGLLIGTMPLNYLNLENINQTYLICAILGISMFGSTVVSASCKLVHFVWVTSSILPLSIFLILSNNFEYSIMGWMLLLTGIPVSIMLNIYNYNTQNKSLSLRLENVDLLNTVQKEKEKAERANKEKSHFLAASSHDLRQPLHALDLFLGALSNTLTTDEQLELLNKAKKSSAALSELLNALMDISRLDAGNIAVKVEKINLHVLINDIADESKPLLKEKNISLRIHTRDIIIESDKLLLTRLIRNLLNNAIKHSKASKLLFGVRTRGNNALIELHDNGIGIPSNEQNLIYSEFYQLNNPERDRTKGLGLGLAIVKRISELLNHQVKLYSYENKGCCFRVFTPLSHSMVEAIHENGNRQLTDISGLFIILIEDEKDVRDAMRTLLKQWGCELLAGDSLDAIEADCDALPYEAPNLLLVDYRLRNKKNGLDAITALRKRFNQVIPAIVITGETEQNIIQQIYQANCELLNKPIGAEILKLAIAKAT